MLSVVLGKGVNQLIITRILTIERDAAKIQDDAQLQAAQMSAQARDAASALREQILSEARQTADALVAEGRASAEARRAQIISKAEAEADHMEETAAQHLDRAVDFVLAQVTGCE
jgi:vacuolar-type H+-ATPase subunit H